MQNSPQSFSKEDIKNSISNFPFDPGVYIMRDANKQIIYVGKAKKLRNRVRSYFSQNQSPKTRVLVDRIASIDFIITENEYEALILENNLIKEHNPRYNINLRDGKTYPRIRITADDYPQVFRTRNIVKDNSEYFGPFADVKAIDVYLSIVDSLIPLRKCKGKLLKRDRPCLYYHIQKCPGPCINAISKEDYALRVDRVRQLFTSSPDELKTMLRQKMQEEADAQRYEGAAEFRDHLRAIEAVEQPQHVDDRVGDSRDYIAYHEHEGLISFVVFQMREGKLVGTDIFRNRNFASPSLQTQEVVQDTQREYEGRENKVDKADRMDDSEIDNGAGQHLEEFIMRYYEELRHPPEQVYIQDENLDIVTVQRFFTEERGNTLSIGQAKSDRDRRLLNMAGETARQDSIKRVREFGDEEGILELQKIFQVPTIPRRIEGFDIAHLQGKYTVAAMVSFKNGIPDKKAYRSFNIRSLNGKIDDYESIREVIARRYTRVLNEKLPLPDLILIDGGKGQLSAACQILASLELEHIPVLALAKEQEEIFTRGELRGIQLPAGTPALRVLQAVRDEAHRFGTSLNQSKRGKDFQLESEKIVGFGPRRSKLILAEFHSYEKAIEAGSDEIHNRTGIPLAVAESFVQYFTEKMS